MSENGIRADHKADTRNRIVQAVSALVAEEHPAAISVPAVAKRAGVGVATVYRHFPTKEALLDAAATGVISEQVHQLPTSFSQVGSALGRAWSELGEQMALVRNQFASPVGRDLHRRRWQTKRAAMADLLAEDGIDPASPNGERLLAVADVLTSSTALLELHDKAGIPVDTAAEYCAWAIEQLVRAARKEARQ